MVRSLTALLCGAALAATAAPVPRKVFPYKYDQHDFPNGLRLITIPTDYPNVVALYIVVAAGSRNEMEPGKSGFAHFFEHMMFRGTPTYPPAKYEDVLKRAGAKSNAYTTDDRTVYHMTFSKEDLGTMLALEADRFQNLDYSEADFRTEALAILGEYNKNSADPSEKLYEVLRDTAFDRHTYKHTTMGFLKDIEDMPNQYAYSKEFFNRWYRPEYTTIVIAGDVDPGTARALVEKHWGGWKRGTFKAQIPAEPPQNGPREKHIAWPTPTLPWLAIAYRGPAYSDTEKDLAALDLIAYLGFSSTSELYQKLVIRDQSVDAFGADNPNRMDPYLFTILARLKKPESMDSVRKDVLATLASFKEKPVDAAKLQAVKDHLRYSFALSMDNSEAVAATVAPFVALRRTPETINRVYEIYDSITPEDIQNVARMYFTDDARTIVTLTGGGK